MSDVILKAISDLGETTKSQIEAAKADAEKSVKELNEKVADLNKELGAKGATIAQLQDEVKELNAKGGRFGSANQKVMTIKSMIAEEIGKLGENFAVDARKEGGIKMSTKTVADMATANLASDKYQTYLDWKPGMRPMGQTRFRDFVRVLPSATDYIQFPRAASPVGEGAFARQTEGSAKPQVDYDFSMISVTLDAIAGYATVSRQALRNIVFLQEYLPQTMLEDLLDTEDSLFSADLVAAATGSTTATGANNEIEKLVMYIRNLRQAKHNPNAIAVDPEVWTNIILTQTAGGGYNLPNVVAVDPSGIVRILGRPVYEVNWLTGGNVIVGDWNKVAIVESEGLTLRQSDSHASTFTANQVTYLLERTEDVAIFRPDAFITADLIA